MATLASYRASLAIMDPLAKSNPSIGGRQDDLSSSYNNVGDVQMAQGDLNGALASCRAPASPSGSAGEIQSNRLAGRSGGGVEESATCR